MPTPCVTWFPIPNRQSQAILQQNGIPCIPYSPGKPHDTGTKISIWYHGISSPINLIIYPPPLLTPSFFWTSCSASGCKFFPLLNNLSQRKDVRPVLCYTKGFIWLNGFKSKEFLLPVDFVAQRLYALKSSILLCIILNTNPQQLLCSKASSHRWTHIFVVHQFVNRSWWKPLQNFIHSFQLLHVMVVRVIFFM